jgi:NitT/TauT family transport system ATP-binding protein
MDDVTIDLPDARDQLGTRGSARFGQLRGHVFEQIQKAKQGWRPASETTS